MNLIIANLEEKISFTESINRVFRVMRFTIHSGVTVSPLELHNGRKLRTVLTKINIDKSYFSDWKTMNFSVPPKQISIYVPRNEKRDVTEHMITDTKRKIPCCSSHKSSKTNPIKTVSGNLQYPYTFLEKSEKITEMKYEEQPKNAVDEHTVRTTDKILHRKLMSTPFNFQRWPKKDVSPKQHTLWGPGGKKRERFGESIESVGRNNLCVQTEVPEGRIRWRRQRLRMLQ